jgi:flagellar biosynthesis/type III secretory pathway M-ring protein FliF/YscJ
MLIRLRLPAWIRYVRHQNRLLVVLVAAVMTIVVVVVMFMTYSNDHLRLRRIW